MAGTLSDEAAQALVLEQLMGTSFMGAYAFWKALEADDHSLSAVTRYRAKAILRRIAIAAYANRQLQYDHEREAFTYLGIQAGELRR